MHALICSVGGSPEPVRMSIETHKPEYLIYVASQDSRRTIRANIEAGLAWQGIVDSHTITLSDFQNLLACVQDIRNGIEAALRAMNLPEDTLLVADITGGTKVMSAALALVMMEYNSSRFAYVGGDCRTRDGLGVVESGHEKCMRQDNPWDVLALREARNLARAFNAADFAAALATAKELEAHASNNKFYASVRVLVESYAQWDAFDHNKALESLKQALNRLKSHATGIERLRGQLAEFENNMAVLEAVQLDAQGLRSTSKKLSPEAGGNYLVDLLGNASRRIRAGRYDDAAARLYSAIEKIAKIALLARHGIDNSNIDPEKLPEAVRESLAASSDANGLIRIGLQKSFHLLAALGDPLGKKYLKHEAELNKVLEIRNLSLLAHGYNPVKKEACDKLFAIALDFLDMRVEDLPGFPQVDWKSLILPADTRGHE